MLLSDFLQQTGASNQVVIPPDIAALLRMLDVKPDNGSDEFSFDSKKITGRVILANGGKQSPIPGIDLTLGLPTQAAGSAPVVFNREDDGFKLWIVLSQADKVFFALQPLQNAPGAVFLPAKRKPQPDGTVEFEKDDDSDQEVMLVSGSDDPNDRLAPSLLISGSTGEPASIRFTPDTTPDEGIVPFRLEPRTVLIKETQIALEFTGPLVFDDNASVAAPSGPSTLKVTNDPTSAPTWRGIVCRELKIYLPLSVPLFGGRAIDMWCAVGFGGGVSAAAEVEVSPMGADPGGEARPGFSARIECIDPAARGLAGLVPTLISATMELPIGKKPIGGKPIDFLGGKLVRARLTLHRDPVNAPGEMRLSLAFDAQGEAGLLSVKANERGAAHFFNVAAGMATALIANSDVKHNATLTELALAGEAGSALFKPQSEFVLHGLELETSGHGQPVGKELRFALDYSVALSVVKIGVDGVFSVEMKKDQPMRFRMRKVMLTCGAGGVGGFRLDYDSAEMEIENPGAWKLDPLENLFDVLGGRSGRGSIWAEVDLRFKLNLGPIQVSGMTLRATLGSGNALSVSVTRMAARICIPMAIDGEGEVDIDEGGFSAYLAAKIVPINVVADALVIYVPGTGNEAPMTLLSLGVDLPAPIPLANSGLGLFGLGGMFGVNAQPKWGDNPDPIKRQLEWEPRGRKDFSATRSGSTFGLSAVIGTLPDMGFAFSSKSSLMISVPDVMVRGALNGRVLAPRVSIDTPSAEAPPFGYSAFGVIGVDNHAVSLAVSAQGNFKPLLSVVAPFAAYFKRDDTSDWFVYLGADGKPGEEGRGIGPIAATVLPDLRPIGADAYLMMRGKGVTDWPYGRAVPGGPWSADGFIVAFGFSAHATFGARPFAWAELNASLDLLLGTQPPTMAGFGSAGGSLHLGPFSVGVQASVAFKKQAEQQYLWAEVAARIELLFTHISGRVTIGFGDRNVTLTVDEPQIHPLDRLDENNNVIGATPVLTDDTYRILAYLTENPDDPHTPTVWPDIIISVPFAVMPRVPEASAQNPDAPGPFLQFPGVKQPAAAPPKTVGANMLTYEWTLNDLSLHDVTDAADPFTDTASPVQGKLAASWQAPRASASTINELVLGSRGEALWANRLGDGGKSLDTRPLEHEVNFCTIRVDPVAGWAVGSKAWFTRTGTRVPAESIGGSGTQSLVQATARHFAQGSNGAMLDLDNGAALPAPYRLIPAAVQLWEKPGRVHFGAPHGINHEFSGHCWLPNLCADVEDLRYPDQVAELAIDESIRDGQLLLVLSRELLARLREMRVCIWADQMTEAPWEITPIGRAGFKGLAGEPLYFALAEPRQKDVFVKTLHIRHDVAVTSDRTASGALGVVGLRGITRAADDFAAKRNAAIQEKTTALAGMADNSLQAGETWMGKYLRTILDPGRLYRLDVDLGWTGKVFEQHADGSRPPAATQSGQRTRHFFFRTAAKAPSAKQAPSTPQRALQPVANLKTIVATSTLVKLTRVDRFDASMIERYFGDYTPAQSELNRFWKASLSAHFTQDHVVALAKAYGFDLKLAVRRVDRPGEPYAKPVLLDMIYTALANPSVLSGAQQRILEAIEASPCRQPKPGRTGTASVDLEPSAWYELYVAATENDIEAGRLRGVTFRTSRWANPEAMLEDVLTGKGDDRAYLRGDLLASETSIDALRNAPSLDDDRLFEQATVALGADGWPACEDPRMSWLWIPAPGKQETWRLAGVMVESPEPLERPGIVTIDPNVDLQMGQSSQANALKLVRRDRAGCRMLFLAAQPITVKTWELATRPNPPIPAQGPFRPRDLEIKSAVGQTIPSKVTKLAATRLKDIRQPPRRLTRSIAPALVFHATASEPNRNIVQSVALNASPSFAGATP